MPRTVNRREFVAAALAGAAVAVTPSFARAETRRPNILFILADDLGYGDLSCFGRPDYQTPNLDRLAAEGVRFANAYSASPLCTPTRCAFMTGRYPARTRVGLEEPLHEKRALGERVLTLGLPPEHPTIASLLKQSGYETALIGKWHLGYLPNFGPIQSGFEEFFGIMSGAADFFTHKDMEGDPDLFEGKVPVERIGYTTDLLTARAVEYISRRHLVRAGSVSDRVSTSEVIRQNKKQGNARPFYLSLHYTTPHWPWEAAGDPPPSPELRGPIAFRAGGSLKTYAAMMQSMDRGIGKVLKALRESGHEQNTIVIFTSDNGGERFSYNWPFVGEKNSLWQGGIRVPAIVRWPGAIKSKVQGPKSNVLSEPGASATGSQHASNLQAPMSEAAHDMRSALGAVATGSAFDNPRHRVSSSASGVSPLPPGGRIVDVPAITMDWTATILAAGQVSPDPNYPLDGIDLLPFIRLSSPSPVAARPATVSSTMSAVGGQPSSVVPRTFFWRNGNQAAAVKGPWKYLNDGTREYLFNLAIDQREQANFRDQNPELFNQLRTEFKNWETTVLPRKK
jgi:arylsulfatase A-like enzyme